ncbi:MAG: sulfotransferase [Alphaproteobacteria bacterium]
MLQDTGPDGSQGIFVLGMHRSGTSAVTGALAHMGVAAGDNLLPAREGVNDKGFWEQSDAVDLNDAILQRIGSFWDDFRLSPDGWWRAPELVPLRRQLLSILRTEFGKKKLWTLKDPRLCLVLPFWLDAIKELKIRPAFVVIFRQPLEVSLSLERRDGIDYEKSILLWLRHNLNAELWSRGYPRLFVRYRDLLDDPAGIVLRIGRQLGISWPKPKDEGLRCVRAFMEPSLRHHSAESEDELFKKGPLGGMVRQTWQALIDATRDGAAPDEARFDALRKDLDGYPRTRSRNPRGRLTWRKELYRRELVRLAEKDVGDGGWFDRVRLEMAKAVLALVRGL